MADIFISYAREDRGRAEQMARGLESAGLDVFWDNEIPPGQTWADYIETKLTQCKALIVLWSEHSTKSQWVREEARLGRDKGVLIPVMIDNAQAPFGFGEVQAANLSAWSGAEDHPDWRRFVEAVKNVANNPMPRPAPQAAPAQQNWRAAPQAAMSSPARETNKGVPTWVWIAGGVVGVVALLAALGSMLPDGTNPQSAAINPAMQPPPVSAAPPPVAGGNYQQQIMARLGQVEQNFLSQGFQRWGDPVSGQLAQGQTQDWPVTLNVGAQYWVAGVCDNDCGDLDLIFLDGYGNVISQDSAVNAQPVVSVMPTSSGQFMVRAHMYNCTVAPCYYALALYWRSQ